MTLLVRRGDNTNTEGLRWMFTMKMCLGTRVGTCSHEESNVCRSYGEHEGMGKPVI